MENDSISDSAGGDPATQEIVRLVRRAAQLAEVSDFVDRLENGWATKVGPRGQLVSGGQRQRIALARALVKDPPVLILDEATAALDTNTERKIQEAIYKVAHERTVISIAHRLSTIKDVDNIIVMRDGEVAEQGTYSDLTSRRGVFSSMVRLQGVATEEDQSDAMSSIGNSSPSVDEKASTLVAGAGPGSVVPDDFHHGAAPPGAQAYSQDVIPAEPQQSGWGDSQRRWIVRPPVSALDNSSYCDGHDRWMLVFSRWPAVRPYRRSPQPLRPYG